MGKVVKNYSPVVYLYWVLWVIANACLLFGIPHVTRSMNPVITFTNVLLMIYIWQQRRAWVTRYETGENCCVTWLITCFCWCFNYGQLGGHKDSQINTVHVYLYARDSLTQEKMQALLIASILVYAAWSTSLFFYFLGPWGMYGLDLYICWPTFTIPALVAHQLIELILLKGCGRYHIKTGRGFHATWTLHGAAALITTSMSAAGIVDPYADDPGFLLNIFLICNAITLILNGRIFYLYKDFTLPDSSDEEAPLQTENNLSDE